LIASDKAQTAYIREDRFKSNLLPYDLVLYATRARSKESRKITILLLVNFQTRLEYAASRLK
jgi:hypothetical protein